MRLHLFSILAAIAGMGTITGERTTRYAHPFVCTGYTGIKGQSGRFLNQHQKRRDKRRVGTYK